MVLSNVSSEGRRLMLAIGRYIDRGMDQRMAAHTRDQDQRFERHLARTQAVTRDADAEVDCYGFHSDRCRCCLRFFQRPHTRRRGRPLPDGDMPPRGLGTAAQDTVAIWPCAVRLGGTVRGALPRGSPSGWRGGLGGGRFCARASDGGARVDAPASAACPWCGLLAHASCVCARRPIGSRVPSFSPSGSAETLPGTPHAESPPPARHGRVLPAGLNGQSPQGSASAPNPPTSISQGLTLKTGLLSVVSPPSGKGQTRLTFASPAARFNPYSAAWLAPRPDGVFVSVSGPSAELLALAAAVCPSGGLGLLSAGLCASHHPSRT